KRIRSHLTMARESIAWAGFSVRNLESLPIAGTIRVCSATRVIRKMPETLEIAVFGPTFRSSVRNSGPRARKFKSYRPDYLQREALRRERRRAFSFQGQGLRIRGGSSKTRFRVNDALPCSQ